MISSKRVQKIQKYGEQLDITLKILKMIIDEDTGQLLNWDNDHIMLQIIREKLKKHKIGNSTQYRDFNSHDMYYYLLEQENYFRNKVQSLSNRSRMLYR